MAIRYIRQAMFVILVMLFAVGFVRAECGTGQLKYQYRSPVAIVTTSCTTHTVARALLASAIQYTRAFIVGGMVNSHAIIHRLARSFAGTLRPTIPLR